MLRFLSRTPLHTVEVKAKITSLFRTKFPLINSGNYDYVKRERSRISIPVTDTNFDWNFAALRGLWGQGKLYCRLNVPLSFVKDDSDDDDNDAVSMQPSPTIENASATILTSSEDAAEDITTIVIDAEATCSSTSSTLAIPGSSTAGAPNSEEHVTNLTNLVHELLEQKEKDGKRFNSLESALVYLKSKLGDTKERHRVSPDYALEEALTYYKSSEFQSNTQLAIQYKGQAAIDTGGVLRQFYSDVFFQMMNGDGDLPPLFEGADTRKLPVHNVGTVISGVFELVGKIFAHSIVQVGVGPACLSPGVFKYFVTGDLTETITFLSVEDATNPTLKAYMKLVDVRLSVSSLSWTPTNPTTRFQDWDISEVTKKQKWVKNKPDLDKEELRILKAIQKAFEEGTKNDSKKDDIDLFGLLVSAELRKLNPREQRIASHQIQNVLFNLQMQQDATPAYFLHQPSSLFPQPALFQSASPASRSASPFNNSASSFNQSVSSNQFARGTVSEGEVISQIDPALSIGSKPRCSKQGTDQQQY
eukprot:gene12484-13767_t